MSICSLLESFWSKASKELPTFSTEFRVKIFLKHLFTYGLKPSLQCFRVWGCQAELKIYNLQLKKTDPKSTSLYCSYADRLKGLEILLSFPKYQVIEYTHVKFFENGDLSENTKVIEIVFEEERQNVTFPVVFKIDEATVAPKPVVIPNDHLLISLLNRM